ncbi:Zinc finger C6HC-type [Penicillium sp. DV-2018c]|nr:Zinc finger C6HC-type [Penicillium sp. DV-2018c]KAJ5567507.1 Zinc finger C6HC-type [Penicillium sp. DV-2018c]
MGPKQKGGQRLKQNTAEEVEETFQAVVLADTFETRFEPFTRDKPRCLLPLANTPLIEYTLEFLANAGVEEVFLYGGAHSDQLEKYIIASKWRAPSSPFKQLTFLKSTSTSVGDVMRDLDGKHLITGDFIVVSGDVISNLPIEGALAEHRARRETDKNAIMTMVLREAGLQHRTKSSSVSPVFVIDPTKDRCLHYEEIDRHADGEEPSRLNIDPEIILKNPELDIRQDLIDCSIDICTPDVLSLWSDSFDYQSPRKHYLYGVLKDYELNGKTLHTYIIKDHYAARVRNLKAYDAISKDILSRWTYPLCPDTNLLPGHTYTLRKGSMYQETGVVLARSCVVGRRTVIGRGTSIGDRAEVHNSVLGRNCKIGRNVKLDGAYIWDNVVIGDNTVVRGAIIADGVVIGKDCNVAAGALLSYGVKISDGISVESGKRITKTRNDGSVGKNDPKVVGEEGEGYEFVHGEDEEDDEDDVSVASSGLVYRMPNLSLSSASISTLSSEISNTSWAHSERSSFSADEESDNFHHDASVSLFDSLREGVAADVVQLELVTLRMTANASDTQVRRAIVSSFMKHIQQLMEGGKSAGQAVSEVFTAYKEVVERTLFDRNKEQKKDQVDLLLLLQQDLIHRNKGDTVLLFTAKSLYELEVVDEEAYDQWWNDERSSQTEEMRTVRNQTKQFVDWLAEAEEESSEEESEEESDDEKAAEAAIADKDEPLPKAADGTRSATLAFSGRQRLRHQSATETETTDKSSTASNGHKPSATSASTAASMDSDDECMSDVSSQEDFLGTQGSDDESLGEDFDDLDHGFSDDKDLLKNKKKPYEVEYKVLDPSDIDHEQLGQVNEVCAILGLPPESAAILLRFGRWNKEKLIEGYMEQPEKTLEQAGLGSGSGWTPKTEIVPGFTCDICCEDGDDLETYAMRCGHRFCVDCYRQYLGQKIKEEGEAARIQCPGDGCNRIVDHKSLELLVAEDLQERYHELLTRTYVDDKENLKWCPAPNCEYAIDCGVKSRDLRRIVPTVQCACKHEFCFGCTLNDHQPAPCKLVKMWLQKCEDDSETANWISANTKECAKCNSTIEKNGGCNHMTCRKCKYEFCWMCMGLWSEHGTSWYNCNRYEEKSGAEARSAQAKSRSSLERYLHYYNRYANHEQSAKLDKDLYLKTEKKMTSLQLQSGLSWIEVQFLDTASQALQQCRQTLKWTYAFAFYLARNNLTEIFEDNQKDLEMAVESLSEMFEKPVAELADLKVDILDKTAYCNKRRVILLSDTAENLKRGEWSFNVEW